LAAVLVRVPELLNYSLRCLRHLRKGAGEHVVGVEVETPRAVTGREARGLVRVRHADHNFAGLSIPIGTYRRVCKVCALLDVTKGFQLLPHRLPIMLALLDGPIASGEAHQAYRVAVSMPIGKVCRLSRDLIDQHLGLQRLAFSGDQISLEPLAIAA
jgi:hypothetical protein